MNVWQIILVTWLAPALIVLAVALRILLKNRRRRSESPESDELR